MIHTKEWFNGTDLDLFTLVEAARFEDTAADYWLKGKILKLWLLPSSEKGALANPDDSTMSRARPHRIQAIGDVSGHSVEMDIEQTDQLIALFRDVAPPEPVAGPVAPMTPGTPPVVGPRDPAAPQPPVEGKEPEKPAKPPMKIKARMIDTWVDRYPTPTPPAHGSTRRARSNGAEWAG